MNIEQQKALARARARMRAKEANGGSSVGPNEPNTGWLSGLIQGVDQLGMNIGRGAQSIGEITGIDAISDFGDRSVAEQTRDMERRNYQRPENQEGVFTDLRKGEFGDAAGSAARAVVESGPSVLPGLAASALAPLSLPAAAAFGVGTVGVQALGETRGEKEEKGLDPSVNVQDIATAVASGLIEIVPGGRAGRSVVKFTREGLQEAGQEGLIIGNTALQGGEYVPEEVANRLTEAGIAGGVTSTAVDAGPRAVDAGARAVGNRIGRIRTDAGPFDAADADLKDKLIRATDGDRNRLAVVHNTTGTESAQGLAHNVRGNLQGELAVHAANLKSLIKSDENQPAQIILNGIIRNSGNFKHPVAEADLQALKSTLPDTPDVDRFIHTARQLLRVDKFTEGGGDLGGISGLWGRYADPTDGRNSGITKAAAMVLNGSGFSALAKGLGINRTARAIDTLTNRRSTIKRYVDSVEKSGVTSNPIQGATAPDILAQRKAAEKTEKLASEALKKFNKQTTNVNKIVLRNKKKREKSEAETSASTSALANAYTPNARMYEDIFEEDAGLVESNDPIYSGYKAWQSRTGLSPNDTLQVIEQLEREEQVPEGTAQRYREDIRSFKTKEAVPVQELVRKRANPDHQYTPPKGPEQAIKRLQSTDFKPANSNSKFKMREGQRAFSNVTASIENAKPGLNSDTYAGLKGLANGMNRGDVPRDDRMTLMDEGLTQIFPDQAQREFWRKEFIDLAAAGNDYVPEKWVDPEEQAKEQAFEEKVQKAKPKKKKKKKRKPEQIATELDQSKEEPEAPNPSPADTVQDAKEVKPPKPKRAKGRNSISNMVADRLAERNTALAMYEGERGNLEAYRRNLPKNDMGRVQGIILDIGSDHMTQNMITDRFRTQFDLPIEEASRVVDEVLSDLETAGQLKRVLRKGQTELRHNGKVKKGEDGKTLRAVQIRFQDAELGKWVTVAKAVNQIEKMALGEPNVQYTPTDLRDGAHRAFNDYDSDFVDGSFAPVLDFLNDLRGMKVGINTSILDAVEKGIEGRSGNHLSDALLPKTNTGDTDYGNIRTIAQLQFMLGKGDERQDNRIRQEWSAGANLRVYSKNGMAHTQSGDLMKGLTRLQSPTPVGGMEGLGRMFQSFGNLLGRDKDSIASRREAIFDDGVVDALVKFAENPFGRNVLNREGSDNLTKVGELVDEGEGFFQVLNAATEVKRMVDWAQERHGDKNLSNSEILSDPRVQSDLAENYTTDFVVQFDASNNAYQLAGLTMGDETLLQSTGLMPTQEGNPDETKAADIYMSPAKAVTEVVPEIAGLGLPDSKVRKLFKTAIGNYLYESELASRRESFRERLLDMSKGAEIVGIGDEPSLIKVPDEMITNLRGDGHPFRIERYDENGNHKKTEVATRQIVKDGDRYRVKTGDKKTRPYDTEEEAIKDVYLNDIFGRMDRELKREMNTRFPGIRDYLKFAGSVSKIVKDRAKEAGTTPEVFIQTPDGMTLRHTFKDDPTFVGSDITLPNGSVIPLGLRTDENNITGRGVGAFMMHQLDAYVLREVYRRGKAEGLFKDGFNPIHDSYGMSAADSPRVQEIWAEVMQELGSPDYNIFLQVLEANQIKLDDFINQGGVLPNRRPVNPVPFKQIPTSLS